ncbi:HAD-IIB family hydrolase [Psychrobacillus lasiicapitis]|uniref:HAD-IIB family hydrolase n=1 Tax=Psychrobacillus lasiicapitis TaxID=1636719 RepID=A0A544SWN9_9BACI|nr:HAD-IIB family hydrolase [Psychrobacillus lasiicapitis]TQR09630.1 HAD-IIB family hydrolase [Psychrobacillus lasiicapitis]GGA28874.1 hydrolase [Psychrobacillus lasiicapitis]
MKFVFDLDGTICFKGQPLCKEITEALQYCRHIGHEVIFASARPIRDLLPVLPKEMHTYPMIGGNGAFVANEGKVTHLTSFDNQTKKQIVEIIEEFQLTYLIDSAWDYAYTGSTEHPIYRNLDPDQLAKNISLHKINEMIKIVLFPNEQASEIVSILKFLPVRTYTHGQENILDISPIGVDKWVGLQKLNVKEQEFIAFGNDANDISMFQFAKESVCVGKHEELQKAATLNAESNAGAVADKIRELSKVYAAHLEMNR